MKNFKLFLPAFFLFFLGMQNPAIAQAGLTCANPVSLDVNNCIQSKGMGTNETWFSFTAQTTVAKITIVNPAVTTKAHIHRVVLFDEVNIECNVPYGAVAELKFFDMNGRLLITKQLASGQQLVTLDVHFWQAGVYMYEMVVDDKIVSYQKMVITSK